MNKLQTPFYPYFDDSIYLSGLQAKCIIGIFDWERKKKQSISVNLRFAADIRKAAVTDQIEDALDYKQIAKASLEMVSKSSYFLIETLAETLASVVLEKSGSRWVHLELSKPGAIRYSEDVGISIFRTQANLFSPESKTHTAYLSLGSNISRNESIRKAVELISEKTLIRGVSSVYESSSIGTEDKPDFWNLVLCIETALTPVGLKRMLEKIESDLGRRRTDDKYAPREIDIDIVFYDDKQVKKPAFSIPHQDSVKEHYILIPMAELAPDLIHPSEKCSVLELLGRQLDPKKLFRKISFEFSATPPSH